MFPPCNGDNSLQAGKLVAVTDSEIGRDSPPPTIRTKLRLLNNMDLMDGRTRSVRAVKEFEHQMTLDLANDLTEVQKALVRRCAILSSVLSEADTVWCTDGTMDLASYCTATNSLRRLAVTLGCDRVQRAAGVVELMEHD